MEQLHVEDVLRCTLNDRGLGAVSHCLRHAREQACAPAHLAAPAPAPALGANRVPAFLAAAAGQRAAQADLARQDAASAREQVQKRDRFPDASTLEKPGNEAAALQQSGEEGQTAHSQPQAASAAAHDAATSDGEQQAAALSERAPAHEAPDPHETEQMQAHDAAAQPATQKAKAPTKQRKKKNKRKRDDAP